MAITEYIEIIYNRQRPQALLTTNRLSRSRDAFI
ncbi:hypothetical protein QF001_000757 [Paraburkholderia youngii]